MIFVTVGTQAPFDRLIRAMDGIASQLNGEEIIAQSYQSKHMTEYMKMRDFISPQEYNDIFSQARLIVSHAGTGTILSALTKGKPIIIMPRKASLGEHRNEHQIATVKKFTDFKNVYLANNEEELQDKINLVNHLDLKDIEHFGTDASNDIILSIRNYLLQ